MGAKRWERERAVTANETESDILELVYSPTEDAARSEINQYITYQHMMRGSRKDGRES